MLKRIGMPDEMTGPRGINLSAPAEGQAPEPGFSSGRESSGRGQQAGEYLKLNVGCPPPYVSLPSVAFRFWSEGGLYRRKGRA